MKTVFFTLFLFLGGVFLFGHTSAQDKSSPKYRQAVESAKLNAQRNLAERVLGLLIQSGTEVKDFVTQKDVVVASVNGHLQGVAFSAPVYDPSSGTIKIRAQIKRADAAKALKEAGLGSGEKLPETIDAIGEVVYEEKDPNRKPPQDPKENVTEREHPQPEKNPSDTPMSGYLSKKGNLPYSLLTQTLIRELEMLATDEDFHLMTDVVANRTKIYLGLVPFEGLQLQLRLSQEDIQLLIKGFIFNYEERERLLKNAEEKMINGVILSCYLRGNKIEPTQRQGGLWWEGYLDLYHSLAQSLMKGVDGVPSPQFIEKVNLYSQLGFTHIRATREVQMIFRFDSEALNELAKTLPLEARSGFLSGFGNGVEFSMNVIGDVLPDDSEWYLLGTPIQCPEATRNDFAKKGYYEAKDLARKQAEEKVLRFLGRLGVPIGALPSRSPAFQGMNGSDVVLNFTYSANLLRGFLEQKYSEETVEIFLKRIGSGISVWASAPL